MNDLNYEYVCKDVAGRFWSSVDDLIDYLESENYEVIENCGEYIVVDEGNGSEWLLYLARANRTIWVAYVKEGN